MTTALRSAHRLVLAAVCAAVSLTVAAPARAQTTTDSRLQPWLGCWLPTGTTVAVNPTANAYVCVVPADKPGAVTLVTVADGRMSSRERLEVGGQRQATEVDGCTGWEQAEWSSDARRIYRKSEYQCPNGIKRTMAGLFGMTSGGDWLDVMSVTSGDNTGVRVVRYRPAFGVSTALPAEDVAALQQRAGSIGAARTAASGVVSLRDVIDVSHQVTPAVAQGWLTELSQEVNQKFDLTADKLTQLATAGVSPQVTDLLVALAYPRAFTIQRGATLDRSAGRIPTGAALLTSDCAGSSMFMMEPWYRCGWMDSRYGYGGSYGYGYNRYGYGPWGTWYPASEPVVIINNGGGSNQPVPGAPTHGQVVNGRGYAAGPAADSGSSSSTSTSQPSSTSSSGSAPASSGGGSSSGDSGSSSSGERTAHPR
ncbi:MAG: hypothetical protein ABI051_03630 [Vicinamibacterales bacterium]